MYDCSYTRPTESHSNLLQPLTRNLRWKDWNNCTESGAAGKDHLGKEPFNGQPAPFSHAHHLNCTMPSALDATAFVSPHGRKDVFSPSRDRVLGLCSLRGLESVSLTELAVSPHHIDYMGHVGNAHYSTFMNVSHNRIILGVVAEVADEKTAQELAFATNKVALVPVRIATDYLLPVGFPDAVITVSANSINLHLFFSFLIV